MEKDIALEEFAIELGSMFSTYCMRQQTEGYNDYRRYMFNYMGMSNYFFSFYQAMLNGDRITQEKIMIDFIGVFHVLGKHKYFQITSMQVEREYGDLDFKSLHEIRCHMAFRYAHKTNTVKGSQNPSLHVLDEVMENINHWSKKLPLGNTEQSWKHIFARLN
mmetsp:Transcript_10165/g.14372  ORF Transcript_10165/g.14372 Transcript_10165/m.14372 type:complete len:162 (-) Transcript_10165:682-1167(-)